MAARHAEAGAMMSIFLAVTDPSTYGMAEIDETGRIKRFLEKPGPPPRLK